MDTKVRAKRWQRDQKYPHITEEIVLSVFEYLPIKSLLRFRCVSKQWCGWIGDGDSRKKLLVVSRNSRKGHSFGEINQRGSHLELDAPPSWAGASRVYIGGSCDGLLLMEIGMNLYLWNPSIRWYNHISSSYVPYSDYYVAISGLCSDSTGDEYKVVRAWSHRSPHYGGQDLEVYSLKNKSWKAIKDFPYDVESCRPGPSMHDRLHWVVSTNVRNMHFFAPQLIVYFEAKTEKFEEFLMPDLPKGKADNAILGLGVLDGCLCMVLCEQNAIYEGAVQILSMKEYGVKESWTILFRVNDIKHSRDLVPCFYTGEGNTDIIMKVPSGRHGYYSKIRVYKTNDGSFVKDISPLVEYVDAIVYEETFAYRHDGEEY